MKTIHVVAAVIEAVDEQGKEILFATQRGYGDMKGGWEFPSGKIEPGETQQEALKREIIEVVGNSPVEKLSREKRRKRHSNEKYRKNLIPKSRWEVLLIH